MHYTRQQIDNMKAQCDLVELARYFGFTPVRVGRTYSLKEHDSVRIYNHKTFYRNSLEVGGDAIVFLQHFMNCSWQEAVEKLNEFTGNNLSPLLPGSLTGILEVERDEKNLAFELPEKAENYRRLYAYLIKSRGLDKAIIDLCVKNHLIYESKEHHNIVFLSRDQEGTVRHAFMRGTNEFVPFKSDVTGSDKQYGFNIPGEGKEINVFESAIDALSEYSITHDSSMHRLAMGGVYQGPLDTYLNEHPEIKTINFCLDNDAPGRAAAKRLSDHYVEKGYIVHDVTPAFPPGKSGKDYNDLCRMQIQDVQRKAVKKHACR